MEKYIIKIKHGGTIKTAGVHRVCRAPEMRGGRETDSEEDNNHPGEDITNPTQAVEPVVAVDPPTVVVRRTRRSQAEILSDENRRLLEGLP